MGARGREVSITTSVGAHTDTGNQEALSSGQIPSGTSQREDTKQKEKARNQVNHCPLLRERQ